MCRIGLILLLALKLGSSQLFGENPGALGGIIGAGDPDFELEIEGEADKPELPSPPDSELNDLFWPDFDPTSQTVEVSENYETGDTLFEIRARHPKKLRLEIECYQEDTFVCISQNLGGGDWQFQVLSAENFDREKTPLILLSFAIWTFDTDLKSGLDAVYPYNNKNFTLVIQVTDVNDNAPKFSEDARQINVPMGLPIDEMIETGLFVTDLDEGTNADVNVVCDLGQSLEQGCDAFGVVQQVVEPVDPKIANYTLKLIVKPLASTAPAGQQFGLVLVADDNPVNLTERMMSTSLLLVNIVGDELTTAPKETCPCMHGVCAPYARNTLSVSKKTFEFAGEPHYCHCEQGYFGKLCSKNACTDYCQNGGTCVPDTVLNRVPSCLCLPDFTGVQCEFVFTPVEPTTVVSSAKESTEPDYDFTSEGDDITFTPDSGQTNVPDYPALPEIPVSEKTVIHEAVTMVPNVLEDTTLMTFMKFEEELYEHPAFEGITSDEFGVLEIGLQAAGDEVEPEFKINNEPMRWFELGPVSQMGVGWYRVIVQLRPEAQLSRSQPGVSSDGIYTFSVQASIDNIHVSTTVAVYISPATTTSTTDVPPPTVIWTTPTTTTKGWTGAPLRLVTPPVLEPLPPDTRISLQPEVHYEKNGVKFDGIPDNLVNGDFVPGFHVIVMTEERMNRPIPLKLTIKDEEGVAERAFEFYPRHIRAGPGRPIYLRIKDSSLLDSHTDPDVFKFMINFQVEGLDSKAQAEVELNKKAMSGKAPEFFDFEVVFTVPENSLTGTQVGHIEATDADEGQKDNLLFSLNGDGKELFAVHSGTLSVACPTAAACLDREYREKYDLLVVATDSDGMQSEPLSVMIKIEDKNDNGPKLETTSDKVQVSKGMLKRPVVISVRDPDISPNNKSIVKLDGSAGSYFMLHQLSETNYQLKLSSVPSPGKYELEVEAEDSLNEQSSDKLKIEVEVMDAVSTANFQKPQYERTVTSAKIFEGNPLLQLKLEGQYNGPIDYRILSGNPGWLTINPETGLVSIGTVPEGGVPGGKHHVLIAALDKGSRKAMTTTMFLLTIIGNRMGSIFPKPTYVTIADKESNEVKVLLRPKDKAVKLMILKESIEALDKDLKGADFDNDLLKITQDGDVILDQLPSDHRVTLLRFKVFPDDSPEDTALVNIFLRTQVEEVIKKAQQQSKPMFSLPWTRDNPEIFIKIAENTKPGYLIALLPAHNPLTGMKIDDVTLSGTFSEFFDLDAVTGRITVQSPFDFETLTAEETNFVLKLTARYDSQESVALLNITITDTDDNVPEVESVDGKTNFEAEIPENTMSGTVVFKLLLSDKDSMPDPFQFELLGKGAENFQMKKQDDRSIALIVSRGANLDYERMKEISLLLNIRDSGDNVKTVPMKITLTDENDNGPKFLKRKYTAEVVENWPLDTTIVKLSATDPDSGDFGQIVYSLAEGADESFSIDPDTGSVKAVKPLLNMAKPVPYQLHAIATDKGGPAQSTSVDLDIIVIQADSVVVQESNALQFISPSLDELLELPENTPSNKKLFTVRATYGKTVLRPTDVKYSMTGNGDEQYLHIDADTGDVYTAKLLDYEEVQDITVIIWAESSRENGNKASRLLRIKLYDQDDNLPVFDREENSTPNMFLVPPEMDKNYTVGYVKSYDSDRAPFNQFRYYFLTECENYLFGLDSDTGRIYLTRKLTDDVITHHRLCMIASPQLRATSPIDIPYSKRNMSMTEVTVEIQKSMKIVEKKKDENRKAVAVARNNAVVTIGSYMNNVKIPMRETEMKRLPIKYELVDIMVKRMGETAESPVTDKSKMDLFVVDPKTADVRASPEVAKDGQGIYTLKIKAIDELKQSTIAKLTAYVHVVEDTNKLMYVFDLSSDMLETKKEDFSNRVQEFLEKDPKSNMTLVFADPQVLQTNEKKSSMCFHAVKDGVLLNRTIALKKLHDLAAKNNALAQLYTSYKTKTIKNCQEVVVLAASTQMATEWVWWIFAGLLAILILLTLICYLCYVKRYKRYMLKKKQYRVVKVPPAPIQPDPRKFLQMQQKEYDWKESSMAFP